MTPETIAAGLAFFQGKRVAVKSTTTDTFYEISSNSGEAYFDDLREYTILPNLPWYRVAMLKNNLETWTVIAYSSHVEAEINNSEDFVCWLGERKTYDPEQVGK